MIHASYPWFLPSGLRAWLMWMLIWTPGLMLGQVKVAWSTLEGVDYSYVQNMDQNVWYGKPAYAESVKALEGKTIQIKGYVLPLDVSGDNYVLSAFPFSSCFFCGGAGQESVMELRLADPEATFKQDDYRTFVGTLRLNYRELELNYILEDARLLK